MEMRSLFDLTIKCPYFHGSTTLSRTLSLGKKDRKYSQHKKKNEKNEGRYLSRNRCLALSLTSSNCTDFCRRFWLRIRKFTNNLPISNRGEGRARPRRTIKKFAGFATFLSGNFIRDLFYNSTITSERRR